MEAEGPDPCLPMSQDGWGLPGPQGGPARWQVELESRRAENPSLLPLSQLQAGQGLRPEQQLLGLADQPPGSATAPCGASRLSASPATGHRQEASRWTRGIEGSGGWGEGGGSVLQIPPLTCASIAPLAPPRPGPCQATGPSRLLVAFLSDLNPCCPSPPTARDLYDNVSHKCAAQPSSAAFCDFPSVFAGRLARLAQHSWCSPPLPASPGPHLLCRGHESSSSTPEPLHVLFAAFTWPTLACPLGLSKPAGQGTPNVPHSVQFAVLC